MYPEIATTFLPTIEGPDDPTCQMAKREGYGVYPVVIARI
jgi:hypothetical protein